MNALPAISARFLLFGDAEGAFSGSLPDWINITSIPVEMVNET
jgi:hypothetical protein